LKRFFCFSLLKTRPTKREKRVESARLRKSKNQIFTHFSKILKAFNEKKGIIVGVKQIETATGTGREFSGERRGGRYNYD
jgi:hypothetical protein